MSGITIQIQSVLYHNKPEALERAWESLANAIEVCKKEGLMLEKPVLCYGDASAHPIFSEEDLERLQKQYGTVLPLEYTYFNENTGTAKGHNRMAQDCEKEYILIMNPDVVVNPRIFLQMLKPFQDPEMKTGLTEARQTPIEHHKEYDKATGETSWASTACALFPVAIFKEIGGFDEETFFMYCDDLDFSWRIRLAGYKIIYLPDAPVFHGKTLSADGQWIATNAERYFSAEAAVLMAYKWSNPQRVEELLGIFERADGMMEHKVVAAFKERQKTGRLPEPLDPEHRVASFTRQGYGQYRFMY